MLQVINFIGTSTPTNPVIIMVSRRFRKSTNHTRSLVSKFLPSLSLKEIIIPEISIELSKNAATASIGEFYNITDVIPYPLE